MMMTRNDFPVRGALVGLVLTAGFPSFVLAENGLEGRYTVTGIENDGVNSYQDQAVLTISPEGECELDYGAAPDVLKGICLIDGEFIAASSVMGGHWLGLFRRQADGSLSGVWRIEGEPGQGTERLVPQP